MYFRDRPLMVVYHNNLPGPNKKKAGSAIHCNKSLSSVMTQIGFCNTNIHWIAIYPLESTSYPTFEKPEPFHYWNFQTMFAMRLCSFSYWLIIYASLNLAICTCPCIIVRFHSCTAIYFKKARKWTKMLLIPFSDSVGKYYFFQISYALIEGFA